METPRTNSPPEVLEAKRQLESTSRRLELTIKRLERLVHLDELTGLHNRRYFNTTLKLEMRRATRSQAPLSLVLCDIDHFKRHNDNYGHSGGDIVLRSIADVLEQSCRRAGDHVVRYGGDEFALILPNLEAVNAIALAEQIRRSVENLAIRHANSEDTQRVTVSIGIATLLSRGIHDGDALVDTADAALYEAKATGRNRTRYRACT